MREQRNRYKGNPPRPWIRLALIADNGARREMDLFADTGSPCALIVSHAILDEFNLGLVSGMNTNFGRLEGGWFRVQIPSLSFDEDLLGYGSDAVVQATHGSHSDFEGLAGLPLLRMMEYGGDQESFWLREL